MSSLVPPHGAKTLKPLLVPEAERAEETKRAERLKRVPLSSREVSDLFMLAMGAYTPLDGFMGEQDWRGCCVDMALSDGLFWPIPITLSCSRDLAGSIGIGELIGRIDRKWDTREAIRASIAERVPELRRRAKLTNGALLRLLRQA